MRVGFGERKNVKAARAAMDPGSYPVDVTVHLSGNVTIGEDTDKASTSSLVSEAFLILALKMSGCTRERRGCLARPSRARSSSSATLMW